MSTVGIVLDALILSAIIGNIARLGLFAWRVFDGMVARGVELRRLPADGPVLTPVRTSTVKPEIGAEAPNLAERLRRVISTRDCGRVS